MLWRSALLFWARRNSSPPRGFRRLCEQHCSRSWPRNDVDPATGRQVKLAVVVLTYNSANGNNCAVTLKRYRVGKKRKIFGDFLEVALAARPLSDATTDTDDGEFKYFAGPTYVPARDRCVQWSGGATLLTPPNSEPRGYYQGFFKSPWEHCG